MSVIEVFDAHTVLNEAQAFYEQHQNAAKLNALDKLVAAKFQGEFAGIVRLCLEEQTYTLRSMLVREECRRLGLGKQLLVRFERLVQELGISTVFCIPYAHLENFYSDIGFERIDEEIAPGFLQERVKQYRHKRPEAAFIIMRRMDQ